MEKSVHSPEQQLLQGLLREARITAKLRQVDLAERLRKPQSFVSRYESGERMLDLPELRQVLLSIDVPLVEFVQKFEERIIEEKSEK